ncbi:patatin-like phospholipase family protein [Sedimentitalea sp. JM2-8]|uniref:Patatin-like phospholipase family protein n=1 Tax=Sedimentitalea xiamensis TaxID=3050037 RepID=A0ABT7FCQ8_9RHOB|nr:patatin-like phospholipase family protein [Sedimentitalea xiamensis]MDK3072902.1 patatin-like phospholipase family protein [Sedimentitalea xiamensis]
MPGADRQIDIALQGGGAHGAFSWGVLDRLLEEESLEISGVSGASAGAMNAVALTQGLATGSRQAARELLERYWRAVSDAARFSPLKRTIWDKMVGRWSLEFSPGFVVSQYLQQTLSPYQLNPLDINPLRDLVIEHFDFDLVNSGKGPKLFLGATNVRSGLPKIFRQPQITADAVMASACLPFLFKAVEIDGEAYWDGGYMGNPPLFPLIDETETRDILLVQINPFRREELPRTAYEIQNRLNEITFNGSLIKEMRSIGFLWEMIHHEQLDRAAYRDARVHRISAEKEMGRMSVSSKLNAERRFLDHLFALGRRTADTWLDENFDKVGVKSTWYPDFLFEESLEPAHLDDKKREIQS